MYLHKTQRSLYTSVHHVSPWELGDLVDCKSVVYESQVRSNTTLVILNCCYSYLAASLLKELSIYLSMRSKDWPKLPGDLTLKTQVKNFILKLLRCEVGFYHNLKEVFNFSLDIHTFSSTPVKTLT